MANQFTTDIAGAVNRGLQFRQAEQLRPGQLQSAQLGVQRQQQQLTTGGLQQEVIQQGIESEADRIKSQRLFNTVARLRLLPDDQKGAFLERNITQGQASGFDMTESIQALELVRGNRLPELNEGLENLQKVGVQTGFLKLGKAIGAEQAAFESLTKDLSKEQRDEAILIKLGINPRAVSSADITIAESPELTNQVANSKAIIGQRKKFGELTGSSRAKLIDKGFEKIVKIDSAISNIDRAIVVLKSGAGVGAIERFLPSFKAASVELDNIQKSMALDVIGAVTFGALSQGELNLAKEVALPTGLDTPQLIQHLNDRKIAQEKLRAYFNEQIQFLDQGGTVAGFLREKERQAAQQNTQVFNFDAQGNLIQ